ncbi:unnamed protein product [Rotaria sp. Silwood2]|nr:unnamed protein product [Rotaria sp. Silwood2]CAF4327770.1 unnamed protein product [Rotaria sp. Silwood2]CAF4434057.1 unnamed protein product [Rotaria sp. Silwood2]
MNRFEHFLRELFSSQCQLNSLRLDIGSYDIGYDIDHCKKLFFHSFQNSISNELQSYCATLSRLHIHIRYTYFLEHLIEHIPNLEQLSIKFNRTLNVQPRSVSFIEKLTQSNGNWFNKVPKLRYFTLKTFILNDLEFIYLKWLLNNLNHVQTLKLRLANEKPYRTDQMIWRSLIDASFVRQYCLPDITANIIDFDFYISSHCLLLPINVEKVINSFKFHPLFINRQWTNVKCLYDPITSYQYLFSTNINSTLQFLHGLVNHPYLFEWPNIRHIWIDFHPSLYIFLEQLDRIFPNVSSITVYMDACDKSIDRNKARAKVLAHLISMPVQLEYLLIEKFQWVLHVIEYAFNELKENALSTVRYFECDIPSCHRSSNESIYIGKQLVPFLTIYMPHLHTLRLWRPDDFPWTTGKFI